MPNPKLETYKNKATGDVYDFTDADAQGKLTAILDGTTIDSFSDVESALADKVDVVSGKGLSTNDYDNTAKGIVDNIQSNVIANTKLIKDTVGWSGKNKCKFNPYASAYNSVTPTIDRETQTISYSGNASAISWFGISEKVTTKPASASADSILLKAGSYKLVTKQPSSSFNSNVYVAVVSYTNGDILATVGGPFASNFTLSVDTYVYVGIRFASGYGNGTVVNAMIVDADILDSTYEPYFGSTAFPRSEQAVLGAKNFALSDVLHFALAGSVGNSVFVANNDVIGFCAKVEKNTDYTWDYVDGDRYRLALSANYPVNDGACYIEYVNDTGVKTHTFNSGNYEYVYLYCYNNNDKTYEEIKPLCTLASDTDRTFVPPAMTNRELTEFVTSEELTPTIHTDATNKISIASSTHIFERSGIVAGSLRIVISQALTAGQNLVVLPKAPENTIFTIGIDTSDGTCMPVIINGGNGNIQLFGDFVPTNGHNLIVLINFEAK